MNEYAKLKLRRRERDSLVTPSDFLCGPGKELPCHAVAATPPPARPRPVLTRTSHMQVLHTRTNEEGDRRGRRTRTDGLTDLSDACRPCIPEPLSPQCGECHVMNRRQSVRHAVMAFRTFHFERRDLARSTNDRDRHSLLVSGNDARRRGTMIDGDGWGANKREEQVFASVTDDRSRRQHKTKRREPISAKLPSSRII